MSDEAVVVLFGNTNPQMQERDAEGNQVSVDAPHLNQSVTSWTPGETALDEAHVGEALSTDNERLLTIIANSLPEQLRAKYALAVFHAEQIIGVHAAGTAPAWVRSNDEGLAEALAAHFNCEVGEPVAVLTESGRDKLHEQNLKSSAQPVGFEYGALSPSAATPAAADTTLAEEITTAAGGLLRKKMGFAHTAGTNTSTLTETWTANGSDSLPVTIKLFANFNLAKQSEGSGKGMCYEDKLATSATLSASGDSITITFTATVG